MLACRLHVALLCCACANAWGSDAPTAGNGHGIEYTSAGGGLFVNAWLRGQVRYSDPFDSDPANTSAFEDVPGADLDVRRARVKMEGHVFNPAVGFYFEHELMRDAPLLDLRLDLELRKNLLLRVGQHKVLYNRERVDSSGKQQFAERSIVTSPFTLDRQRGATLRTHWSEGTTADSWLMLGVFEGDSRDPDQRGDDPMVVARWQWQFLGEALPFAQSDHGFRDKPAASLSFAAARVRGPYTRFSSSGGGQLDGFAAGDDDRYTLEQWMQEFAWHFAGMSVQQEYHEKRIKDHETGRESTLRGGYAQFGKAWPVRIGSRSYPLELAARIAHVDWDDTPLERDQDEVTLAANLFLNGHDHKLTVDVSRLSLREAGSGTSRDTRFRLQWDLSF